VRLPAVDADAPLDERHLGRTPAVEADRAVGGAIGGDVGAVGPIGGRVDPRGVRGAVSRDVERGVDRAIGGGVGGGVAGRVDDGVGGFALIDGHGVILPRDVGVGVAEVDVIGRDAAADDEYRYEYSEARGGSSDGADAARRAVPLPRDGTSPTSVSASAEGRALFREALAEGNLEGWFALAEQFQTQADPAFCGLGTLVVALNALGVDPGRLWKGPWRWYSEELLDCCLPLETVRSEGITLDQFSCLARCNWAAMLPPDPATARSRAARTFMYPLRMSGRLVARQTTFHTTEWRPR
jgi:hypothetical protein